MIHICMLTGTHTPFDARIFHKESKSLRKFGYEVTLVAPSEEIIEDCDRDGIHLVPLPAGPSIATIIAASVYIALILVGFIKSIFQLTRIFGFDQGAHFS